MYFSFEKSLGQFRTDDFCHPRRTCYPQTKYAEDTRNLNLLSIKIPAGVQMSRVNKIYREKSLTPDCNYLAAHAKKFDFSINKDNN